MRTRRNHQLTHPENFKKQLLNWAQQFDDVIWFDSNNYPSKYSSYDAVLAVDAFTSIRSDYVEAFNKLQEYQSTTKDWIFGYLTYDLKNDVEDLTSSNFDGLDFPELYFFQPKRLFFVKDDVVELCYLKVVDDELDTDFKNILNTLSFETTINSSEPIKIKVRIQKDEYFEKVGAMLNHIQRGDIYEANFCQEFYAEDSQINPLEAYFKLNAISKTPFATFLRLEDKYLLSATPERYIKKMGQDVISQPIKGTAKRSKDAQLDKELSEALSSDEKERSENIMIVDLVRNDLSLTALKGSVNVEELCEVYTFPQVHQMISTIRSKVSKDTEPVTLLKTTFPMGSMTGAPKISAMTIIEDLEETKRGLYSGSVGYFTPEGDFDFNVVIRSILYNASRSYISCSVGSAITAKSNPLKEYEECLVKAKAMREVLEN